MRKFLSSIKFSKLIHTNADMKLKSVVRGTQTDGSKSQNFFRLYGENFMDSYPYLPCTGIFIVLCLETNNDFFLLTCLLSDK